MNLLYIILADAGDLFELFIFLAFVIGSAVISTIKSSNKRKQEEKNKQLRAKQSSPQPSVSPRPVQRQTAAGLQQQRARKLPYAKHMPPATPKPPVPPHTKQTAQSMDARQIPQQPVGIPSVNIDKPAPQINPPASIAQPQVRYQQRKASPQPRYQKRQERMVTRSSRQRHQKTIKKSTPQKKPKILPKACMLEDTTSIRSMLSTGNNLRKAIVLSEILGPPVSLK